MLSIMAWLILLITDLFIFTSVTGVHYSKTYLQQLARTTVSLKLKTSREHYSHFCTGSILSERWVLTAGHCFTTRLHIPPHRFVADAGSNHRSNKNGSRYIFDEYHVHPNQTESFQIYEHDLCLIKLKEPIAFSKTVQPVSLGTIHDQRPVVVIAAGWKSDGRYAKKQLQLFRTVRYAECEKIHSKQGNLVDREAHICVYGGIGKSLCFGDSGSPLFDPVTKHQVAVFSTMEDCSGEYPLLFVRIATYINWINDVTKLNVTLN